MGCVNYAGIFRSFKLTCHFRKLYNCSDQDEKMRTNNIKEKNKNEMKNMTKEGREEGKEVGGGK